MFILYSFNSKVRCVMKCKEIQLLYFLGDNCRLKSREEGMTRNMWLRYVCHDGGVLFFLNILLCYQTLGVENGLLSISD